MNRLQELPGEADSTLLSTAAAASAADPRTTTVTTTVSVPRRGQAAIRRPPLKPLISGATLTTSPDVGACTICPLPM
jgi:hypothetical protein